MYGVGLNPIGLKLELFSRGRWRPFVASSAGILISARPVPVDSIGGTRFNFALDAQAGLSYYSSSSRRSITVGYKYLHISNGDISRFNPGLDVHMLFAGYSWSR